MMLPAPVRPSFTRCAPTTTTSTRPMFSRNCMVGELTAMTEAALTAEGTEVSVFEVHTFMDDERQNP